MSLTKTFSAIGILLLSVGQLFAQCSEPFFSEYIEGSSNNKAVEIYNPASTALDLSDYQIFVSGNGGSFTNTLDLTGMLMPGDVYVVSTDAADAAILAIADTALAFPSVAHFNGDDAIALVKLSTGDTLDLIGEIGVDPGSNWPVGTGATSNHTLVRMASVNGGTTDWSVGATQWEVYPQDDFSFLGSHTMTPCASSGTGCSTDIFFSEYIEGSSNNKGFEIYNPNDSVVDLSNYQVFLSGNGGSFTNTFDLYGTLATGEVFIITTDGAAAQMLAEADTALAFPSVAHFNGDDALGLVNLATGDTIDLIGVVGVDPGSNWPVDTGSTSNHTLVRMASVNEGTTDWSVGATQWLVYGQDDFSFFGDHTMQSCGTGCTTDIFISEYIEGSSNNKGFEIFNPNDSTVDLSNYEVFLSGNGGSFTNSFSLYGTLATGEVFVITTDGADSVMLAQADTALAFPSVAHFNGDDALGLINLTTGDTIDVIGVVGVDPGSNWPVDTGSTANHTLVRSAFVTGGQTDWAIGATEWDVYPSNFFDSLGSHSFIPCNSPAPAFPTIEFGGTFASVSEAAGTITFDVEIANATADTAAVDVMMGMASTATLGTDFSWTDTTIVFPANATMPITLSATILDDADIEDTETIIVKLMNATNGAMIGSDSVLTVEIEDNDYPLYPIGLVTADADGDGQADSLDVRCELRGVVYGVNLSSSALQFAMRDTSDGIQVFAFNVVSGYTVQQGDSLHVQGVIDQFNGLAEIIPDSIQLISSGNAIADPVAVTTLDEATENEYVQLNCVRVIDPSQWPSEGSNSNVDFTNGVDTFTVRIDKETDVDTTDVPVGFVNLRGIGAQFDGSFPYNDGYQVFPQFPTDIMMLPAETADLSSATESVDEGAGTFTFEVIVANANPDTTTLSIAVDASSTATEGTDFTVAAFSQEIVGCGESDTFEVAVTITDDTDVEGDETIVLVLSSSDTATVISTDTLTVTITETDNLRDMLPAGVVRAYPNPGSDLLRIESGISMDRVTLVNLNGQTVAERSGRLQDLTLSTKDLPAGVYLLRVETSEGMWMQRWVKQ